MARELVIHIGHGKTGTSFIQSTLAINRARLEEFGWTYPQHPSFAVAAKGFVSSGNGAVLLGSDFAADRRIVVSGESLFHQLAKDAAIEQHLLRHDCPVRVILYARNVFDMLVSSWGQSVKRGGKSDDLNTFLRDRRDGHHARVLWWIDAAGRYGFPLALANYSNRKAALFDHFAVAAFGEAAPELLQEMTYPKEPVNRSLTESEYRLQAAFNRHVTRSASYISDQLVNRLPTIRAEIPYIERASYEAVAARYRRTVDAINAKLDPADHLLIEPYEALERSFNPKAGDAITLSERQMDVLAASIGAKLQGLLAPEDARCLRDAALKIAARQRPGAGDVLALLRIAQRVLPEDEATMRAVEDLEATLRSREASADDTRWQAVSARLRGWFGLRR
ncbi:hypothetical protein [Jiella sonneratiae]|uniref:Sulfotransferase family protein n=1 Tax=Jiella sonneratiae TaxID=2816856 RepID=A0ABS3J7V6_9HYPH|nr:hypothetical protein [Jiella sonneratiae]MBO0905730.1 hypothetical protein [Jiella sonneratiae]